MREDRGQRTSQTDLYDEFSAFIPDRIVPVVHQRHDGLLQERHLGYGVGVKNGGDETVILENREEARLVMVENQEEACCAMVDNREGAS